MLCMQIACMQTGGRICSDNMFLRLQLFPHFRTTGDYPFQQITTEAGAKVCRTACFLPLRLPMRYTSDDICLPLFCPIICVGSTLFLHKQTGRAAAGVLLPPHLMEPALSSMRTLVISQTITKAWTTALYSIGFKGYAAFS